MKKKIRQNIIDYLISLLLLFTLLVLLFLGIKGSFDFEYTFKNLSLSLYETMVLGSVSAVVTILFAASWSIYRTLNKHSEHEQASLLNLVFTNIPIYFIGSCLALFFGFYLSSYTGLELSGSLFFSDEEGIHFQFGNMILPCITLSLMPTAVLLRFLHKDIRHILKENYILTARGQGFSNVHILRYYVVPNLVFTFIRHFSNYIPAFSGQLIFVEYVFGINGIGRAFFDAVQTSNIDTLFYLTLSVAFFFITLRALLRISTILLNPIYR